MVVPRVHTKGYVLLTFIASEEEGGLVSTCPELGIASQGNTVEEAFDALKDATLVYLNTIELLGERERTFQERGIKIQPHKPTGPMPLTLFPSQIGLPFVAPIPFSRPTHKRTLVAV